MPTTKTVHRSFVVLNLPKPASALVTFTRHVVKAMAGNPVYPDPSPPLATLTQASDDLQAAETASLSRTKGTVAVRNEKKTALVTLLLQLKGHVQTTADANPENGASIIQSAGLTVRKAPTRGGRAFGAEAGAVSGSAKLVAPSAGQRSSYEWQYSLDGGKTWVLASVTLQAKATVPGLTPGATVLFRYRPVTKAGEGDWSQSVSLIVK